MYSVQISNRSINLNRIASWPNILPFRSKRLTKDKQYTSRKDTAYDKKGNGNLIKGTVYLRRLESDAYTQPASLVLQTSRENYLFNCGENATRSIFVSGTSNGRIAHVFLTQRNWNCIGGLTSLQVQKAAAMGAFPTFHGPHGLYETIERMTNLTAAGAMCKQNFTPDIVDTAEFHEDANFRFDKIPIQNKYHPERHVYSYLCRMKAMDGELSAQRMTDNNVPTGVLRKLMGGENVQLDDGRVLTPDDIYTPSRQEKCFLVVDIPSKAYLDDFIENKHFHDLLEEKKVTNLDFIAHLSAVPIFETNQYQQFIERFSAKKHFLFSEPFESHRQIYGLQQTLHSLDADVHPLLSTKPSEGVIVDLNKDTSENSGEIIRNCRKIVLHQSDKTEMEEDPVHSKINDKWIPPITGFETKTNRLSEAEYPHLVFLGTSSGGASYYRSNTSILVNISKDDSILLDCGEGACSQINRFYGDESIEIYKRLKGVFISHMHVDHYMGLLGLLRVRKTLQINESHKLCLIGPSKRLREWLEFSSKHIQYVRENMKIIDSKTLIKNDLHPKDCNSLGIDAFRTCLVSHIPSSCAASLIFPYTDNEQQQKSFKLTFSGDTIPCKEIIRLGADSTLLIHEATFQNELYKMARTSMHSTVSEAVQQGQRMNAEYTILTHFSARYDILPHLDDLPDNVGIAFDNMQVSYRDLARLNGLIPKYEETFPQDMKRNEDRNVKYRVDMVL